LFPFTEFGAVARTYPVACSGVRQRNFDYIRETEGFTTGARLGLREYVGVIGLPVLKNS